MSEGAHSARETRGLCDARDQWVLCDLTCRRTAPIPRPFAVSPHRTAKTLDLFRYSVEVVRNTVNFLALDLNRPEMQLGEVLIPWVVVVGTFGFLAAWLIIAIMERTGVSRYVWHLPLFFLALAVLLTSVIGMLFQP